MRGSRREFLADVGRTMLVASVGPAVAADLGLGRAEAADEPARLSFGALEPLVALLQETPTNKLLPALVEKIRGGTELRQLVAAGALANARQFGGHNYVGFHTFMALSPAYEMSRELPADRQALPVLKVLYRNTQTIQQSGGQKREQLKPIAPARLPEGKPGGELLRTAMDKGDRAGVEGTLTALTQGSLDGAYNDLQVMVQEHIDVHSVVMAWRAWAILDITGKEHALALLRQSARLLVDQRNPGGKIRTVLPRLLDQHKLAGKPLGDRKVDDAWVEKMSQTIYGSKRDVAADAVAAALAEGIEPAAISDALAIAANRLVLCDGGRHEAVGIKSVHSVHGDSVGVHASDAANAWRNIARVSNPDNVVASLIVGAFHTAGQAGAQLKEPYPLSSHLEKVTGKTAEELQGALDSAIKGNDQAYACAIVQRYGDLGHPPHGILDVLLKYAISEDGSLHAEKYYRTASEEFASLRPAFRWRQLVALARVTASEHGYRAAGYEEACKLLKV